MLVVFHLVDLIGISLMISGMFSIFLCAHWSLVLSSLKKYVLKSFAYFSTELYIFLLLSCKRTSRFKSCVTHMICRCFLLLCGLSFFLMMSFAVHMLFILMKSTIYFLFYLCLDFFLLIVLRISKDLLELPKMNRWFVEFHCLLKWFEQEIFVKYHCQWITKFLKDALGKTMNETRTGPYCGVFDVNILLHPCYTVRLCSCPVGYLQLVRVCMCCFLILI